MKVKKKQRPFGVSAFLFESVSIKVLHRANGYKTKAGKILSNFSRFTT